MTGYKPLPVIIGCTASGKSTEAVRIAERYGGEIISADSRQVYRGLRHATGRISEEEMNGIPHHLLEFADPGTVYTVRNFARDATACTERIRERGNLPVITGGTGFYIESILFENTFSDIPPDPAYRKEKETLSLEALRRELKEKDPRAYERTDTANRRRIVRTLEIINSIGSFPAINKTIRYPHRIIGLYRSRPNLRERISERLEKKFNAMTEEINLLLKNGVNPDWFERLGLDCRHICRMLTRHIPKETTYENILRANLAYAKRQETWWKRFPETVWYREHEREKMYRDLDAVYAYCGSTRT